MLNKAYPSRLASVIAVAICVVLAGCATDALTLAPVSPNTPWQGAPPNTILEGDTGGTGDTGEAPDVTAGFGVPPVHAASVLPATLAINPEHVYSLPELIDIAQRENPDTRLAWNRARQAALAIGVTEATFLPMLSANVIGGWQKTHTPVHLLPDNFSVDTELHGVVPALALEWLIFDFGQRKAIADGARQVSYAANVLFNGTHQKIIHDVTHAYYQYGAARAQVTIAEQALKNSLLISTAVDERQKAGLATVVETAQANQQVAQAKLRHVNAQGLESTAYQTLLASVGMPSVTRLQVSEPAKHPLPETNTALTDEAIQLALSQRPDVLASYAAIKAAEAGIAAAEAEFLPKVYLGAVAANNRTGFQIGGLPQLRQHTSSASVLLGVTIPLFDGGLRLARLKDAQIQADMAADVFQQAQQLAMREMIAASDMLRSALASYQAASELVMTADTTYTAALEAYRHGVGTVTVATTAATALLDAQQARIDARTASQTAAANLAFVMGAMTSARDSWNN